MSDIMTEWQKYFGEIAHDLAWSLMIRKVDGKMREFLSPLFKASDPIRACYLHVHEVTQLMSLRRQCTMQPRFEAQGSLLRFISELRDDARGSQRINRSAFGEMARKHSGQFPPGSVIQKLNSFIDPDTVFDRYAEPYSQVLDTTKLDLDLLLIKSAYEPLAPYVDKVLAHLESTPVEIPRIRQGEDCINLCWGLFEKYYPLIFGKPHMSEVGIGPELGWDDVFDQFQLAIKKA